MGDVKDEDRGIWTGWYIGGNPPRRTARSPLMTELLR